jgi:hypothetical protein
MTAEQLSHQEFILELQVEDNYYNGDFGIYYQDNIAVFKIRYTYSDLLYTKGLQVLEQYASIRNVNFNFKKVEHSNSIIFYGMCPRNEYNNIFSIIKPNTKNVVSTKTFGK